MTTRRSVLRLAGALPAAALLAACDTAADTPAAASPAELLVVETDGGLAVIDSTSGAVVRGGRLPRGRICPDHPGRRPHRGARARRAGCVQRGGRGGRRALGGGAHGSLRRAGQRSGSAAPARTARMAGARPPS